MRIYIFPCYMLTKFFNEISTCCVACVKKIKFNTKNEAFQKIIFLFLFT
jgi:hypothetical protein